MSGEAANGFMNDAQRHDFLVKLAASNAPLTEWEHKFACNTCGLMSFSTGQRFVIDNLAKKYSVTLPLPPVRQAAGGNIKPKKKFVRGEEALELFRRYYAKATADNEGVNNG
jgi:hypothetical protein